MVQFEVRLRRDPEADPPLVQIGVFDRALAEPIFGTASWSTTRKELYSIADALAIHLNLDEGRGWLAVTDRRHLYQDFNTMHWNERQRTPTSSVSNDEWYKKYLEQKAAEDKAKGLLEQLNPELAKKVEDGGAFYLQGAKHIYIVSPLHKKLDVLTPDKPTSLCVYIDDKPVQDNKYDWMIAMWKYLTAAEEHTLEVANKFAFYLSESQEVKVHVNSQGEEIFPTQDDPHASEEALEGESF